jgi:hypothetical protein
LLPEAFGSHGHSDETSGETETETEEDHAHEAEEEGEDVENYRLIVLFFRSPPSICEVYYLYSGS